MAMGNNCTCYRQLYRLVPVLLHLFNSFVQFVSVFLHLLLFTPIYTCYFLYLNPYKKKQKN